MSNNELRTRFPSPRSDKKKKDVKLLTIASLCLAGFFAFIFWVFSGSSEQIPALNGGIVPVETNKAVAQQPVLPPPSILDENAVKNALNNGVSKQDSAASGSDTRNIDANDSDEELVPTPILSAKDAQTGVFPTEAAPFNVAENIDLKSINTINQPKMDLEEMKKYLNDIKNDIKVENNVFYYNGKAYKEGDNFNSLSVVSVGNFAIRFTSGEIEYSLRFIGNSK